MKYTNLILAGFIVLWLNNNASVNDRQAVKAGINQLFSEPDQQNTIDYAGLPQYNAMNGTNIVATGRFLVVDEKQLRNLAVNLDKMTVAKLNAWKQANMENPNHLRWARGDSWHDIVAAEGLQIVTNGVVEP